jgi:PAT family beta-lactamase induction signal transducer AmpG
MALARPTTRNPWAWVTTLYLAQGIPYVVVMTVSVIMYKRLGISNTDIALTSWLISPGSSSRSGVRWLRFSGPNASGSSRCS